MRQKSEPWSDRSSAETDEVLCCSGRTMQFAVTDESAQQRHAQRRRVTSTRYSEEDHGKLDIERGSTPAGRPALPLLSESNA